MLENLCGETVDWFFDWPDDPRASFYLFRLYRNDSLVEWQFTETAQSAYHYQVDQAIETERLTGWKWQYEPVYTGFRKKSPRDTQQYTFEVRPPNDPCP